MTSSYLDKALFSDIVKYHNNSMGRKKTTVEWIIQGSHERENSATAVLDSLVRRGILGRESMLFGRKYPTLNSGRQSFVCNEFAVSFFVMHIEFYLPPTSPGISGDKKSFFWPEGRKCLKKLLGVLVYSQSILVESCLHVTASITLHWKPPNVSFIKILSKLVLPNRGSLRKQLTFCNATTAFPAKWHLRNVCRIPLLTMCYFKDLSSGMSSVWNFRHHFVRKPVVASRNVGCILMLNRGVLKGCCM